MKALIVTVQYPNMNYDYEKSKTELIALAYACDITVEKEVHQNIERIKPSTFIGSGKIVEIQSLCDEVEVVIFDEELSPLQMKNLSEVIDCPIKDRTNLILQIFEQRAKTKEAKLQVEIAKYQYLLPRLVGLKDHLKGQLGGSNFRGSGEKQIDLDRRHIYNQLHQAKIQLAQIVKQRQTQRQQRKNNEVKVVALVGYTNSGKSTLFNCLALNKEKAVMEKDMLFATLETSSRKAKIAHHDCMISDTVGFIHRLPHHLVQAFRSTLEEIKEADLLLHVVDSSDEDYMRHIQTTNEVLASIGVKDIEMIYVYNKIDKNKYGFIDPIEPSCFISAKKQQNLETLEKQIASSIFKDYVCLTLHIPYDLGQIFTQLDQVAYIKETVYHEHYIMVIVEGSKQVLHPYKQYRMVH